MFKEPPESKREGIQQRKESLFTAQFWLVNFNSAAWFSRNLDAGKFGGYNPSFKTEGQASEMTVQVPCKVSTGGYQDTQHKHLYSRMEAQAPSRIITELIAAFPVPSMRLSGWFTRHSSGTLWRPQAGKTEESHVTHFTACQLPRLKEWLV